MVFCLIGILCEKPSAAKNFANALGGMAGVYNNEKYVIANAVGHLYKYNEPVQQVSPALIPKYKSWDVANLPWNEHDFKWSKSVASGKTDVVNTIKERFRNCDEIVIATDVDPTGEGELLAWEILDEAKIFAKKYSRMYFVDEAASSIQQAFVSRKVLPSMNQDLDYVKAVYRSKFDFLSQQFTRIATAYAGGACLRQGRLKSTMVFLVGDQLAKIANYKKIPFYQNRFRDENGNVYTNPDEPMFPTKEQVPKTYGKANVIIDSKMMKSSAPPKLLDLAILSSLLSAKGFKSKAVLETYQSMYEKQIVSYPRTEDKEITPQQFAELMTYIDKIADVVGVDKSLLTHRQPRSTHVKTGGSHGANRPGVNVPKSLDALEAEFGKIGRLIYETLALSCLAMIGEDYEYEQQKGHLKEYPAFKATCSVPKKLGYKAIFCDEDDELADKNAKGLGTVANPFVYEGFPPKPAYPTQKWLMNQLKSHDVGTGATRTSIFADVTGAKTVKNPYPLLSETKGKIQMTTYGEMSYKLLKDTRIGSFEITEKLQQDMRDIAAGKVTNIDTLLMQMQGWVRDDIEIMKRNAKESGVMAETNKEKYTGVFNGKEITISRVYAGHRFTDTELDALFNGDEVEVNGLVSKTGSTYGVKGKLSEQEYNGHKYWGFERTGFAGSNNNASDAERYTGKFKGKEITIKREWRGHRFTDDELKNLFAGKEIDIFGLKSKEGKEYGQRGKLAEMEYNGHKYWGFQNTGFPASNRDGSGKPKGVPKSWCQHEFTSDEKTMLEQGLEVRLEGCVSKKGSVFACKVKWSAEEGITPIFN